MQTLSIRSLLNRMLLAFFVVAFVTILPAQATPVVGIAVADTTSTTQVGSASGDGTIGFYIDLAGSSTYGVDGGTSADTCYYPNSCTGGMLTMHLFFAGVQPGLVTVALNFTDLDADGVNDPWFFIEELLIYDEDGVLIATIDEASDLDFANYDTQMIGFDLDVDGDFYITLVFSTAFDPETNYGWYRNTAEYMLATTTSVPEPGTLALFGVGLLLLAFSRRRESITTPARKKQARSTL